MNFCLLHCVYPEEAVGLIQTTHFAFKKEESTPTPVMFFFLQSQSRRIFFSILKNFISVSTQRIGQKRKTSGERGK